MMLSTWTERRMAGGRETQRTAVIVGGGRRSGAAGRGHVLPEIVPAPGRLSMVLVDCKNYALCACVNL